MRYTKDTARKLAKQIRERFGLKIARAVQGTPVPQKFVAGLISVEAGKKNGQIVENAVRFEAHVFRKLQDVRDGHQLQYNKIRTAQLKGASDEALHNLATSFGLTQMMGWWSIHLDCTVADLRNPETHLSYAVQLMLLNSNGDFERGEYEGEFRQWNSGSETGKTFDPDYVYNASSVMDAYEDLGDVEIENGIVTGDKAEPPEIKVEPPSAPQAPKPEVTPVAPPKGSLITKIAAAASAAGPVIGATGLKIGGVEFKTGGLIAFAAVLIVGMVIAAVLYNEDRKRAFERQKLSINNLADKDRANIVAAGSKV